LARGNRISADIKTGYPSSPKGIEDKPSALAISFKDGILSSLGLLTNIPNIVLNSEMPGTLL